MFKTIVVGVDGSEDGDRALALARSLATENDARLTLVHVTELVGGKGGIVPFQADEDQTRADLHAAADTLTGDGYTAEAVIVETRLAGPAHTIAEIATSQEADLIVIGSRGRSPVRELLSGSVATQLLHLGPCPLLVVPAPHQT